MPGLRGHDTKTPAAGAEERERILHHLPDLQERHGRERPACAVFRRLPPDFFEFIIIDECHRGGANDESNWRGILEYFSPAVQLGLTATLKGRDNVDTYAYFGEPFTPIRLKEGINDGFLTPFKVKQIATTLDDYLYTPDDKVIEGEIEEGKRYREPQFNRTIEIEERERYPSAREDVGVLRFARPCAAGADKGARRTAGDRKAAHRAVPLAEAGDRAAR